MTDASGARQVPSTLSVSWSPASLKHGRRNPAWMLAALLVGYPFFWVLGLAAFAPILMAVPMTWELYHRRPVRLPRGFALWALFLIWSALGLFLLDVDPPGYLEGSVAGRMFGYGLRELSYFSVTIVFLFIGNLTDDELPVRRIISYLGWFFVSVTAGGVLGILAPYLHFTSPFEMILPGSIRSNDFVQSLVHPRTAQVQELLEGETPRPAAPFAYTNAWGFHITLLGVWFIVDRFILRTQHSRFISLLIAVVGVVVLVLSLNRAAWMGVLVATLVVALSLAIRGHLALVGAVIMTAVISVGVLVATPLGDMVAGRFQDGKSDDIRGFTTEKAIELSATSPVIGFGTTRSILGSASSIAIGESPMCQSCGNPSIGMNGYLFMLLVTTGYVGATLFFGFIAVMVWRSRKNWTVPTVGAITVTVVTVFYAPFYDAATWMLIPFVSLAILWREDQHLRSRRKSRPKHAR